MDHSGNPSGLRGHKVEKKKISTVSKLHINKGTTDGRQITLMGSKGAIIISGSRIILIRVMDPIDSSSIITLLLGFGAQFVTAITHQGLYNDYVNTTTKFVHVIGSCEQIIFLFTNGNYPQMLPRFCLLDPLLCRAKRSKAQQIFDVQYLFMMVLTYK